MPLQQWDLPMTINISLNGCEWKIMYNKKYVLSNSESVQCNFFIFDHVTFIQFKICCCVQNFMTIWWFFTEIWRYIDFQNGSHPPSWNCLRLCCWPQLPVKFHVNVIHRSEDIAIWIFFIFGLTCLFRPPKWGFWWTDASLHPLYFLKFSRKSVDTSKSYARKQKCLGVFCWYIAIPFQNDWWRWAWPD